MQQYFSLLTAMLILKYHSKQNITRQFHCDLLVLEPKT